MENEVIEQEEQKQDVLSDDQGFAAGYARVKGTEFTPEETVATEEPVEDVPENDVEEPVEEPAIDPVAELRAKVTELENTPQSVRKIYGELGNIQRTLKSLQSTGGTSQEVDEAIKKVESVIEEYPDLAPLAESLKVIGRSRQNIDVDAVVEQKLAEARRRDAIDVLAEEHPDFREVRDTKEYKDWLSSKDEAYQEKFLNTWNPNVVSKGLSEFKAWRSQAQAAKEKKQNRLEQAVMPKGEGTVQPSKLPDDAGFEVGYNKVKRLGIRK